MPGHSFTELTRQRAFMRMWFARLFGTTGNQMLMVAVGWQMYELTGSAWDLGLVGLYQFLPALLLTLVAGQVADRLHRAHIVAACLVTQAVVALILVAATQGWGAPAGWASRELLLAMSVLLGVARAFQNCYAQDHADPFAKHRGPYRGPAARPARQSPCNQESQRLMNASIPLPGETHCPVVIVGAGPTGLILANLLGVYGVKALVIERSTNTVGEPRAVTIDDESLRTVQATGLISEVLPQVVQGYGVHYYSWRGKEFARIEPSAMENGFPKRNAFRQQVLVGQLRDGLQRFDDAAIWFGHEMVNFNDNGQAVHLTLQHDGVAKNISCNWLVACDGGRSGVREQLGIKLTGSTYDEKWLIVDLLDRTSPFRHTRTYCDPVRPAIRLPGPDGTLRYEFMLHEGEDPDEMLDEARVRSWIHAREPADATLEIARKVVYAFHARVAERWKSGRVFLAGDAAHLTPPFAGQGMNSGVRDAANLAWKLAAVEHGTLSAALLDTYELERKPHAWSLIQMAVKIGTFMQPKSALSARLTQGALKIGSIYPPVRDYVQQLKFKPKPRFFQGFFANGEAASALVPAGQLLPQPMVELPGGAHVAMDDVLGDGFALLALAGAGTSAALESLATSGLTCKHIQVVAQSDDFLNRAASARAHDAVFRDQGGTLEKIIRSAGAQAVLLRPDRYVLAYISQQDPPGAVRMNQLLARFSSYKAATKFPTLLLTESSS